jgi:hypothetical protein
VDGVVVETPACGQWTVDAIEVPQTAS